MPETPPPTPRKITLEELLRLKRHERPSPDYWLRFDRELNERVWKSLAQPVESRWNLATVFFSRNLRWLATGAVATLVVGLAWEGSGFAPLPPIAAIQPVKIASNFEPAPAAPAVSAPTQAVVAASATPASTDLPSTTETTFAVSTLTSPASSHKVPAMVAFAAVHSDGVRYATDTLAVSAAPHERVGLLIAPMSSAGRLVAGLATLFWMTMASVALAAPGPGVPPPLPVAPDPLAGQPKLDDNEMSYALALNDLYVVLFKRTHSAVVRINAQVHDPANPGQLTTVVWSGFFINRNGDILTTFANNLQSAVRVSIDCDGIKLPVEVKGFDLITNVGLLHADTTPQQCAALDLTDNPDLPPIGSLLLAITSKQDQLPSPSEGMVQGYNIYYGDSLLQTTHLRVNIPDDGGEGGSPVLDLQGRVVGVMLVSLKEIRSSLVMPARALQRVVDDLQKRGRVIYGRLGFDIDHDSDNLNITSVDYGGPALAAGVKVGDILQSIGSNVIRTPEDFRQAAFFTRPGQFVTLGIRRGKEEIQLTLQVGETPRDAPATPAKPPAPATPVTPSGASPGTGTSNPASSPAAAVGIPDGIIPLNVADPSTPPVEIKAK